MELKAINHGTSIVSILLLLSGSPTQAGTMGAEVASPTDAIYVAAFGGGGGRTSAHLVQQGTALYSYDAPQAGPLAVDAFGKSSSGSTWIVGGHVGYRWSDRSLNHIGSNWTFAPAAELEGYYLGQSTLRGDDLNNTSAATFEHDFHVTYPMQTGVFLVNAVLNANSSNLGRFHPYVGVGAGGGVVSISGANSLQTSPPEIGVNHYNSNSDDSSVAFAAQPKVGVSFNVTPNTNVFVEYRFLYISATNFTFGSTSYPTHVATTNWNVQIESQYYNIGTAGIQFDL